MSAVLLPLSLRSSLRPVLPALGLVALLAAPAVARAGACSHARKGEPMKIHLLTTSPGDQVFNSMGHTAISLSGGPLEEAEVYNWGAYNGQTENILSKFLSGRMEFWLANEVWKVQWKRTVRQDRTMVAQELAVPQARAAELLDMLEEEFKPENRNYIYHWAKDNCATRARDVLDEITGGAVKAALDSPVPWSARHEGARHLAQWAPVSFGFNFLASSYLDQPLTEWDVGMVPERLMKSLSKVEVTAGWPDGKPRPLVTETCTLRVGGNAWAPPAPLPTWPPALIGLLLALGGGGLGMVGAGRSGDAGGSRAARAGAGALLGASLLFGGVLGTVTLLLWANSDLDGVGPTENWAFAGPQTLLLFGLLVRALRGKAGAGAARAAAAIAGLGVVYTVLKPVVGLPQANWDMVGAFLPAVLAAAAVIWRRAAR